MLMLTVVIYSTNYSTCVKYKHVHDMSSQQMNISLYKRKEFEDITNTYHNSKRCNVHTLLPLSGDVKMTDTEHHHFTENEQTKLDDLNRNYQNVHPMLGWYKHDLDTGHFSSDKFQQLMSTEKEDELLDLLVDLNLLAKERQC